MNQQLPSLNVVGAGRLGRVIAKLLVQHDQVKIQGVCNTSIESANTAVSFIGSGVAQVCEDLMPADITMIATPDDAIEVTCKKLATAHKLGQRSVVFHCSGALSSSILQSAKECYVASVHPVKSFADPQASVASYTGTLCSIEGDQHACDLLTSMFSAIGSSVFAVKAASKASYHAAMVFAANYSVALYEMARQAMQQAEIDESIAQQLVLQLMQGTVDNLQQHHSVDKVLSGPLMRGDVATIAAHIDSLPADLQVHYKQLGLYLMQQLNLSDDIRKQVAALFS